MGEITSLARGAWDQTGSFVTSPQHATENSTFASAEVNGTAAATSPPDLEALYLALHGVVMPVISIIGVATNLANIIVLTCVIKRSRTPVYHILLAMAIADFCLMGVVLLYTCRFFIRAKPIAMAEQVEAEDFESYFFFHTWDTFANTCGVASNWCVVAVTTFRFVAVYFPLQAPVWCTRLRARIIIPTIFALAFVLNLPYALANRYEPETRKFFLQIEVHDRYKSSYYIALIVLYHVIPWIASSVLVTLLLFSLWSQQRVVRACSKQEEQKNIEQKRLSVTLITVAAWFIVSTTPKVIYHFIEYSHAEAEKITSLPSMQRLFNVSQAILLMNYASNFFFYAFINQTYRKQLMAIFLCQQLSAVAATRNGRSVNTVVTTHLSVSTELHPLKNGDDCYGGHS